MFSLCSSFSMRPTLGLILPLLLALSLVEGCGSSSGDKKATAVAEQKACSPSFASGESQPARLYRSERAPYGVSCEALAFDTQLTCTDGSAAYLQSGFSSCQATELTSFTLSAPSPTLEVGQVLPLRLQGIDQDGQSFDLNGQGVTWKVSDDRVTVSQQGEVTASQGVGAVTITASIPDLPAASVSITVNEKSCGDLPHGASQKVSAYPALKVPFNASCEAQDVDAVCERGELKLASGFATCEVAKLIRLESEPAGLFLNQGESAQPALFLVDESGARVPLDARAASWTSDGSHLDVGEAGTIRVLENLLTPETVTVTYQNVSATIAVANPQSQPDDLAFQLDHLVVKAGDETPLVVIGSVRRDQVEIDPKLLTWESNHPESVAVNAGTITALVPGTDAIITAKLATYTISLPVTVEAPLALTLQPASPAVITRDALRLTPVAIATVAGPLDEATPALAASTEGCTFSLHKNRNRWEVDVVLNPDVAVIPGECTTEITMASAAGQTAKQTVAVPVHYSAFTFHEEVPSQLKAESFPVATVDYRLATSVTIKRFGVDPFKNSVLSPAGCSFSIDDDGQSLRVKASVTDPLVTACAGHLYVELVTDGESSYYHEFITVSKERSFDDACRKPKNDRIKRTVEAVKKAIAPMASCEKLTELLRNKSLVAATYESSDFTLSLASKDLEDLSPLARLLGLKELVLSYNKRLKDISPLADLKLLQLLNLKGTNVSDFRPVYALQAMNDLRLPAAAKVACSDELLNPELLRVCQ